MKENQQLISAVVYVHDDADKIEKFLNVLTKAGKMFGEFEIVFVDDYSQDSSLDQIKAFFKSNQTDFVVNIIRMSKYHGMERAMNAGRDLAIGDYVYEFDDMYVDYDENVILEAFNKCLEGNDFVSVSTDVPIRPSSTLFYKFFNFSFNSDIKIGPESFRLLSRRGINRIISMDVEIPYRKVIYLNSGLPSANLKYSSQKGERPPRIYGKFERVDLAFDSFIFFTRIVQHLSFVITILFCCFSLGAIIYAIISRVMGYHAGMGWLSLMIVVSVGFAGLFAMFMIIIRYLSVLLDLVFKRQKYLVLDIEKISSK